VRDAFAPIEAELWCEADAIAPHPDRHAAFVEAAWARVAAALARLQG
jgi:hypothetical protein